MKARNGGLKRLLRYMDDVGRGLTYASNRVAMRHDRRCVGCEEADGVYCYPVLGWVCESCDEVLDIVYEVEIERTREAREKLDEFIDSLT